MESILDFNLYRDIKYCDDDSVQFFYLDSDSWFIDEWVKIPLKTSNGFVIIAEPKNGLLLTVDLNKHSYLAYFHNHKYHLAKIKVGDGTAGGGHLTCTEKI